jgi:hypothetical protein
MTQFRSPLVAALAIVLIAIGVGALIVRPTFASPFGFGPDWAGGWHGGAWDRSAIPPEFAGLADVPAGERFSHFRGVQVSLTDKDNKPLTVQVTPGTATTASPTSVTPVKNWSLETNWKAWYVNGSRPAPNKRAIRPERI